MADRSIERDALTVERLRELIDYDPETGIFKRRTKCGCLRAGTIATSKTDQGYLRIGIDHHRYRAHRLAWLYMTGEWPPKEIDHWDLNRFNNKWANIRLADHSQNMHNTMARSDNSCGIKGIWWYERSQNWGAQIQVRKRRIFIGYFKTREEAAKAYAVVAYEHFGEFSRTS
jgi:hypothetical protein